MKKTILLLLLALFTLACVAAEESEARLHFNVNGFSIAPLEGTTDAASYQAVMMFLPASKAFAPNVGVMIQPYNGTINEYADLSKQQFKGLKFTVLSEKITQASVVWEYSGMLKGRNLHWYAKAELGEGKVYLVTATATEYQWKTLAAKLKACVNSFKQEKGEQGTAAGADKRRR
ncbi:MAG: hypothetical protein JRH09_07210 [Deltaproteobacteria bacterium]|nr:hypothetical protein [Deltaproteobacteria bacterium]